MTGVGPAEGSNQNTPEYHKEKEELCTKTEPSKASGGNLDSGYHSFGCSSDDCLRCSERKPEMITTVMGHYEDFPPPSRPDSKNIVPNGYSMGRGRNLTSSPTILADKNITQHSTDREYNSLPDIHAFRHSSVSTSDNPSYLRTDVATTITPTTETSTSKLERMQKEAELLAVKIAFCLKLGYSPDQVSTTLRKIGYTSSKNDILSELFTLPKKNLSEFCPSLPLTVAENGIPPNESRPGDLVCRGISNSVESNLISRGPSTVEDDTKDDEANASENLRPIVIDGSNVAMSHGNKEYFSCKGIQLTVQYFLDRGHRDITVFVPNYRKEQTRPDAPIKDQEILTKLHEDRILVWTPSRYVSGRRITCYDDRFILKLAQETGGVIVSNDTFRDLQSEKEEWKEVIEKRLLMYSFVNDRFMPPDDPLGRNGPSLDNLLRIRLSSEEKKKPECPYGKKCTYGKKCKYFHPECSLSQRSVSEQIKDTGRRMTPVAAAQRLALKFINESDLNPEAMQNGADVLKNPRRETGVREDQPSKKMENNSSRSVDSRNQDTRKTASPSSIGACGVTPLGAHHGPISHSLSNRSMPSDYSPQIQVGTSYPSNGVPYQYGGSYGDTHSPRTDGPLSNVPTTSMSHLQVGPPPPHRTMGRNVVSSTSPQHQHLQHSLQPHSSPPAFMHEKGVFVGHLHTPNQPPQSYPQNMTYPSITQPMQRNYPPHQPPIFEPRGALQSSLMYHYHQAMVHQLLMSQANGQDASHINPRMMPPMASYPYMYPNQHSMGSPVVTKNNITHTHQNNLTSPRPSMEPTSTYEQPDRQVYSSPNPGHPYYMCRSTMQQQASAPYQMQANPSPPPQRLLTDPSNPRHHLYRNLCALFSASTVERVMLRHPNENNPKKLTKLCLDMDN